MRATDLRQELAIPEDVFAGVLGSFVDSDTAKAIEVRGRWRDICPLGGIGAL